MLSPGHRDIYILFLGSRIGWFVYQAREGEGLRCGFPASSNPIFLKKGEFQKVEVRSIGENDTERLKSSKIEK